MKILYYEKTANWNQNLLCVIHTTRKFTPELCTLNSIDDRLKKTGRLPPPEPFESLKHISESRLYGGEITIWSFPEENYSEPQLIAQLRPDTKPQYAIWFKRKLWILLDDKLEIYDADLTLLKVVQDPWLAYPHTIIPDYNGRLIISCAASDAILILDEITYDILETYRLPQELFGYNYFLSREDSVIDHYIPFDLQIAHVNGAWPWVDGILISTWRGSIGHFDRQGIYRELTSGFAGCHGVRTCLQTNQIYFCDSSLGLIIFLTNSFHIDRRISVNSKWLRDAQQLNERYFAISMTDKNLIQIIDISKREAIYSIPCNKFGMGTEKLYYGE